MSEQHSQRAHVISLRPVTPEDEQFLFEVYASTRMDELDAIGMDKAQQEAFINMQYRLQRHHYLTYYTQATHDIVLLDGVPVGRFYINRTSEEIRGVDVALLPAYRSFGIGSHLIRQVQQEAAQKGLPFRLQVEKHNPAFQLYLRLGFVKTGETETHIQMEWPAPAAES